MNTDRPSRRGLREGTLALLKRAWNLFGFALSALTRGIAILVAIIVAGIGCTTFVWHELRIPGSLIVSQPDVYTRERLVNDRLRQEYWLAKQLDLTDQLTAAGRFGAVQARTTSSTRFATSVSVATDPLVDRDGQHLPARAESSGAADGAREREPSVLQFAPVDQFREMVAYRDEVRQELMQTQLDDRHDIAGNTLVRLDFDITTLPTSDASNRAVILVEVKPGHTGLDAGAIEREERKIYDQWRKYLTAVYNAKIENLSKIILIRTLRPADTGVSAEIQLLRIFLIDKIKERIAQLCASNRTKCNIDYSKENTEAILDRLKLSMEHQRNARVLAEFALDYSLSAIQNRLPAAMGGSVEGVGGGEESVHGRRQPEPGAVTDRPILLTIRGRAMKTPISKFNLDRGDYNSSVTEAYKINRYQSDLFLDEVEYATIIGKLYDRINRSCGGQVRNSSKNQSISYIEDEMIVHSSGAESNVGNISKKISIVCPSAPRNTDFDEIDVLSKIYNKLVAYNNIIDESDGELQDWLRGCVYRNCEVSIRKSTLEVLRVNSELRGRVFDYIDGRENGGRLNDSETRPGEISRAVTDFVVAQIEGGILGDGLERVGDYFGSRTVGCDGWRQCRLILTESCSDKGENCRDHSQRKKLMRDLKARERGRIFVYNIAPKQLTEKLSGKSINDRTTQIMAAASAEAIGLPDMRTAMLQLKALQYGVESLNNNSLVVGFSTSGAQAGPCSGGQAESNDSFGEPKTESQACAVFGWILSPPLTTARTAEGYAAVEHSVSATLSVPSWWQSAQIEVASCWVADGVLQKIVARIYEWFQEKAGGDHEKLWSGISNLQNCFGKEHSDGKYSVDLPGTTIEISRTLGLDVRQEPYITEAASGSPGTRTVEIGRAAMLVVQGGRLWRGTAVTIGDYLKADRIEVTPDMKGLIAHFNCVTPPPAFENSRLVDVQEVGRDGPQVTLRRPPDSGPDGDDNATPAPKQELTIWTSEGRVATAMIEFTPFKTFAIVDDDGRRAMAEKPCWLNEQTAVQGDAFAAPPERPDPRWPPPGPSHVSLTPTTVPRRRGLLRSPRRRRACGRSLRGGPGRAAA